MTATPADSLFDRLATESDIQSLLLEEPETFAEFKQVFGEAKWSPQHWTKFSRALSGFANSMGGVLIYGVTDDPRELAPFVDPLKFADRLAARASELVVPPVYIQPKVILSARAENIGYVKILVRQSEQPPHMVLEDGVYYTRSGASFVALKHFGIADLFARQRGPMLRLRAHGTLITDRGQNHVQVDWTVVNTGVRSARSPALGLREFEEASSGGVDRYWTPLYPGAWNRRSGGDAGPGLKVMFDGDRLHPGLEFLFRGARVDVGSQFPYQRPSVDRLVAVLAAEDTASREFEAVLGGADLRPAAEAGRRMMLREW